MNIPSSPSITSPDGKQFGLWGRLPLAQKLFLSFGTVFVFAVVIAVFTLSGSNRTSAAYEDAFSKGITIHTLSDHLKSTLLQARRDEKNFLLRWREEGYQTAYTNYVVDYKQSIVDMRKDIDQLALFGAEAPTVSKGAITRAQYETDILSLTQNVDIYEKSFITIVDAYQRKGFDESTDFESELRNAAKKSEEIIFSQSSLSNLQITFLRIRVSEKNYLIYSEEQYADEIRNLVPILKSQATLTDQLGPDEKTELRDQADIYLAAFEQLVQLNNEIEIANEALIASARAVEPLAFKFEVLGEQLATDDINRAQANNTQTFTISIIIVFIALASSILLSITLSRQITQPVTQLTNTAQQIAEGNFDTYAEVNSADEVGALAKDFNLMTSRLRQAFEDVRRRALAVQTSAEVSQRLSAATNPGQLAVDVVEQVQAAFNYYHAHIYFLDENSGDLIMAGGTGEAGAKMLANKHRVAKGRGLVGRAAATNEPVLVPDVSQAEGWLPNALLPDTQSEVAIPISSGKQVLGVLDVQQNLLNGLDLEDVTLLQSLAGQVAISLQNARSFEQSKAQADLESLVNTIGQKIQRATTVEETLQTAIRELGTIMGAPSLIKLNSLPDHREDKRSRTSPFTPS